MAEYEFPRLFGLAEEGDPAGREKLFVALYRELHRLAQSELQRNSAATLSPTTLLHETFLNLARREVGTFVDKARFMAYAARAMRGLHIDYLRSRQAQKRGGQFEITSLPTELELEPPDGDGEMDKLVDALEELGKLDPRLAECVDLKFFSGFSVSEIARMWSVSERTV